MPAHRRTPKSSSPSSTTSRRLTRLRTDSTATAAWKRGPNALLATSAGSRARVRSPQPGQRTRGQRCSITRRRDDRQLFDLMAHRLTHAEQLTHREHVAALTALRPMLDHLIYRACRQQLAAVTLMPRLGALRTPGTIPSPRWPPLARRIRARRQRRVTRALRELALKLLHPRFELLDTAIHRQQNLDNSLTPRVIDRLRLSPIHTPGFDEAELCPPTH